MNNRQEIYYNAQDGERALVFDGTFSRQGCQLHGDNVQTYWSYQVRKPSGKFACGSGVTEQGIKEALESGKYWDKPRGEQIALVGRTAKDYVKPAISPLVTEATGG